MEMDEIIERVDEICENCPNHERCLQDEVVCQEYMLALGIVILGGPED